MIYDRMMNAITYTYCFIVLFYTLCTSQALIINNHLTTVPCRLSKGVPFCALSANPNIDDTLLIVDHDDSEAESQFGTKQYWDDMYIGQGDFDSEEYSWYFGWETLKKYFLEFAPKSQIDETDGTTSTPRATKMLVPGIGNDGILLDFYAAGYKDITAFDYSSNAIDRQVDLISHDTKASEDINLLVRDARRLDEDWTEIFDVIFEKGGLDAVYLSGEGNVEKAVEELTRVIRRGGILFSVSGVVPEQLRKDIFCQNEWEWIRDGGEDMQAGCFVFKRK